MIGKVHGANFFDRKTFCGVDLVWTRAEGCPPEARSRAGNPIALSIIADWRCRYSELTCGKCKDAMG